MNTLRLSYVKCSGYLLETWIIYAIQRSVRNLYLDFDLNHNNMYFVIVFTLPRCLLTCKTIVHLKLDLCKLDLCTCITSSGEVFMPSLKKLHLSNVEYGDDESLPHLLSGCPVLEELIIDYCYREGQNNTGVVVSSPTIKTLNVDLSYGCEEEVDPGKMLIVNVPGLVYLKLVDIVGIGSMVKFDNLTKLELELTVVWDYLVKLLEVADNLEVLIIDLGCIPSYRESERVPKCMLSCLRTVRINDFSVWDNGFKEGFHTVRYILRNAQVLKRMEIYPSCCSSDKQKLDALRTISLFERGSKSCQIAFPDTV